jgi:hypothetical protein
MRYEVIRGYVRHKGVLYRKGSVFDADENEMKSLIRKGIVISITESDDVSAPQEDGETQKSRGSARSRRAAKSGKAVESTTSAETEEDSDGSEDTNEDLGDNAIPDLDADELIVDAE